MITALLLGSFNPIHRGHTAIARWALDSGAADRVWIVPTPQNPLKTSDQLASWEDRVAMIELAIQGQGCERIQICTIENSMPSPHYTIHTIDRLRSDYPSERFVILCGSDIIEQLPRWHRVDELREMVDFLEYPRSEQIEQMDDRSLYPENSSDMRNGNMLRGLDDRVLEYIRTHDLYFVRPLLAAERAWGEGNFPEVINLSIENPQIEQIERMATLAREILDFRHTDLYNP